MNSAQVLISIAPMGFTTASAPAAVSAMSLGIGSAVVETRPGRDRAGTVVGPVLYLSMRRESVTSAAVASSKEVVYEKISTKTTRLPRPNV